MKSAALIVFFSLAVITAVFLWYWKRKKPNVEKIQKEVVSGTYYLIHRVYINDIVYTTEAAIPDMHLSVITEEFESLKLNEDPFAATSQGYLKLGFTDGSTTEVQTIYNLGKAQYEPLVYVDGQQYYISEAFKEAIQSLSQLK